MTNTTTQNGKVQTTAVSITAATIAPKSFANIYSSAFIFRLDLVSKGSDRLDLVREVEGRNNFPDATLTRLPISPISGSRSA